MIFKFWGLASGAILSKAPRSPVQCYTCRNGAGVSRRCISLQCALYVVAIYVNANAIWPKRLIPDTNTSISRVFLLVGAEEQSPAFIPPPAPPKAPPALRAGPPRGARSENHPKIILPVPGRMILVIILQSSYVLNSLGIDAVEGAE